MGRGHLAVLEPSPETIQLPIDNDYPAKPVTPIIPSHLVKKNQKAYALIYLSLSNTVQGELSPAASDAFNPNAYLLWKELQKNYGASTLQELSNRMEIIWGTRISEGADPIAALSKMRAAYTEVVTTGKTPFDDQLFSVAVLRSLPPSYQPLVQSLYQLPNLVSTDVATSIRTEYLRRTSSQPLTTVTALQTAAFKPTHRSPRTNKRPANHLGKWCPIHSSTTHSLAECRVAQESSGNAPLSRTLSHANVSNSSLNSDSSTVIGNSRAPPSYAGSIAASQASLSPSDSPSVAHASSYLVKSATHTRDGYHVDSGATEHMDSSDYRFINKARHCQPVTVGGGAQLWSTHIGTVRLTDDITLNNVLLVPDLKCNLISVQRMIHAGYAVEFLNDVCHIRRDRQIVGEAPFIKGLYTFQASYQPHIKANIATGADQLVHWHLRLGHLNFAEVVRMGSAGLLGDSWKDVSSKELAYASCDECIMGKGRRIPSHPVDERAEKSNDLVHIDIWGPARTPSLGGSRYFLTCYDDYSRHVRIYAMKTKDQALQYFRDYILLVNNQCNTTVKRVRSDNGGEFTSEAFTRLLAHNGILANRVPPGAHGQNGRVERTHLTILNTVRTLLLDANLPASFWMEAATYAVYVRNRIPDSHTNQSPYTRWTGKEISAKHIRPFGSKIFVREHTQTNKLSPRYKEALLMSWADDSTSIVRYYDPKTRSFNTSRDVVFPSSSLTPPGSPKKRQGQKIRFSDQPQQRTFDKDVVYLDTESTRRRRSVTQLIEDLRTESSSSDTSQSPTPLSRTQSNDSDFLDRDMDQGLQLEDVDSDGPPSTRSARRRRSPRPRRSSSPESEPDSLDPLALNDNHSIDSYNAGSSTQQEDGTSRDADDESDIETIDSGSTDPLNLNAIAHLADTSNPSSYREARSSGQWEHWKTAMDDELFKMEKYQVFEVLPRKPTMHVLKARWVYTRKIDGTTGKVAAYKARWVAKGYAQIEGIHFNDIHASVVHKDSIRVFLSLVNSLDMECDQVDIKAAFLNGELEETIYMEPPEGSDIPSSHVIRLRKSLYGLRQSPRCFNQAFDKWMRQDGFEPTRADPCLYVRKSQNSTIMVSVHVDDQLIASDSRPELDAFKKRLNARFECTDNGPVNYFLGFNVVRDRSKRRLVISQEHYVEALLERFDMVNCNPVRTPLPASYTPRTATDQEFAEAKHLDFPKLAGSVLYLSTITRPDIAFAAGVLARYISKWSTEHYKAAKHLLRYLRGTSDLCLSYDHDAGKRTLLGYADADWGGCQDTRRSTTGYLFKTFGGITSWRARRQPTVSLSTAEAEYMASADAAKQASWLRLLLADLGYPQLDPTLLYNDNMGAILLSQNPVHHDRSKHISLRHHYLREQVGDKSLSLQHIGSKDNQADLLTKNLSADLFSNLRTAIGMRQQPLNAL